jgi:preprotein translocase subunit SecE
MQWWTKSRTFLTEVRAEMKKVSFPSRREVTQTTIVVIVTSVIFAFFLFGADVVIGKALKGLQGVLGS